MPHWPRKGDRGISSTSPTKSLRLPSRLIIIAFLCLCLFSAVLGTPPQQTSVPYRAPTTLATLRDRAIHESSGLVASRTTPGAYWTHNDSGDGPFIYAIDTRGETRGIFRVAGAEARDWEDIAGGPGPQRGRSYLYIGDIGDNRNSRPEVVVYRVPEPALTDASRGFTKVRPGVTERAETIRLKYPDGSHDAEALLVHPTTGNVYIVTKVTIVNPTVYEAVAPFTTGKLVTMKRIGEVRVPSIFGGIITGGSISPDGRRVALCDYFQGYEVVLPGRGTNFDEIWKQGMIGFDLGKRKQGESIAYRLDGKALLATSEGRNSPLIQVERK